MIRFAVAMEKYTGMNALPVVPELKAGGKGSVNKAVTTPATIQIASGDG